MVEEGDDNGNGNAETTLSDQERAMTDKQAEHTPKYGRSFARPPPPIRWLTLFHFIIFLTFRRYQVMYFTPNYFVYSGRTAITSISTSAPKGRAVTPTHVRAGGSVGKNYQNIVQSDRNRDEMDYQ
jgi:hypothetical protein